MIKLAMLVNIFTDLANWVKGWDHTVFVITIMILIAIAFMFFVNILKALISSKIKLKFLSFVLLAMDIGVIVYVCLTY